MSTQLILYPQNYRGRYNSTSTSSINEYVVNGINYAPFPTTGYGTNDNYPSQDAIINQPPNILGNWYSYYTIVGGPWGAASVPLWNPPGDVVLSGSYASALTEHSGIYQQLSGLTIGGSYDIVIDITQYSPNLSAVATIEMYSGNVLQFNQSFGLVVGGSSTTLITTSFVAQSTNPTFLIDSDSDGIFIINNISIQESPETATNIYTDLNDGQVICDLYAEEDIPLTLSIDEFKNVAEQVKSYSKDFNLPATKRNNQIFNNMFEVTRAAHNTLEFNPYIRTQCVLKQDGFILFEGYLRLIDVKDQEGEISYNVNLYSDVVALADILKDQTFSNLDFTELEHDYNKTEIKRSWNESPDASITYLNPATSGFRETYDTLRYPFIDWTHQYILSQNTAVLGPTFGNPELMSLEQAFRPCIQLKYLINKIFAASGFNWTSNFFDSVDFGKLYMDFNWGADNAPVVFNSLGDLTKAADFSIPATYTTLAFDEMNFLVVGGNPLNANFGYSAGVFTAQEEGQVYSFTFNMEFNQALSVDTLSVQWLVNGVPYNPATSTSVSFWYSGNFTTPPLSAGDTVLCQAKSPLGLYELDGVLNPFGITPALVTITTSSDQTTTENLLETLRGEIGQWDFLKGIMTMFNLVSMVDETDPDNILIEPYADVFVNNTNSGTTGNLTLAARSIQHDWTDKVDVSQIELNPLTNLNKSTVFKFVEDDDDYAFNVFKQAQSGHLYGSVKWNADGFTILDGEEEIIAEPFAATVSKPLDGQFSQFITPAIYSMTDDGTSEGFENSPRIFYNNGIKSTGASYYIPPQNGLLSENQTDFLQFSHFSSLPPGAISTTRRDFVFESSQLISSIGSPPTENLFSVYWQPYFNELYNADTRTMTLKVNLSPTDVANFKFYDTIFIKNRVFRVNKIDYKPNDLATVEFILIP